MSWCTHKECSASFPCEMYMYGKCKRGGQTKLLLSSHLFVLSIWQADLNSLSLYIFVCLSIVWRVPFFHQWLKLLFYFFLCLFPSHLFSHYFIDCFFNQLSLLLMRHLSIFSLTDTIWDKPSCSGLRAVFKHLCDLRVTGSFHVRPSSVNIYAIWEWPIPSVSLIVRFELKSVTWYSSSNQWLSFLPIWIRDHTQGWIFKRCGGQFPDLMS